MVNEPRSSWRSTGFAGCLLPASHRLLGAGGGTAATCLHPPARLLRVPCSFTACGESRGLARVKESAPGMQICAGDHAKSAPTARRQPALARMPTRCATPYESALRRRRRLVLCWKCQDPGRSWGRLSFSPHLHRRQPRPAWFPGEDLGWIDADPHVVVHRDNMLSGVDRKWAEERLEDVRVIDTDHFIILQHPDLSPG